MPRNLIKGSGGRPCFVNDHPFHCKHSPGNPFMYSKHDGVSPTYGQGFSTNFGTKLNWLYRFKWNSQPIGSGPFYLRNPGGKCPHWLEITGWKKLTAHIFSSEASMHFYLAICVSSLVVWNLTRYLFLHPDLTIYNVIFFTMRPWVNVLRNNEPMSLDSPVFRWAQSAPEFYNYDPRKDMLEMGVLANDPYVEYVRSIGREKELLLSPPFGMGEGAPGKVAETYLPKLQKGEKWEDPTKPPRHWYAGPDGHGPHHHKEGHHANPNDMTQQVTRPSKVSGTVLSTLMGGPHKYSQGPPRNDE